MAETKPDLGREVVRSVTAGTKGYTGVAAAFRHEGMDFVVLARTADHVDTVARALMGEDFKPDRSLYCRAAVVDRRDIQLEDEL